VDRQSFFYEKENEPKEITLATPPFGLTFTAPDTEALPMKLGHPD